MEYGYNTKLFYQSKLPWVVRWTVNHRYLRKEEKRMYDTFITKCLSISETLKCVKTIQLRIDEMQFIRSNEKCKKLKLSSNMIRSEYILFWFDESRYCKTAKHTYNLEK